MGILNWWKASTNEPATLSPAGERGELTSDLKLERLRRVIIDFPGRIDSDLARIIYGRGEADLIAVSVRKLETAGLVMRDPETSRLYAARR